MARYPIRVTRGTMKRLKSLAVSPNESYDKILKRIIDAKVGEEVITYLIDDLHSGCKLKCVIDYSKEEENILFYEKEGGLKTQNPPLLYANPNVSREAYSDFLLRLRSIKDLVKVLAMLGRSEYTVVNNLRLIRL